MKPTLTLSLFTALLLAPLAALHAADHDTFVNEDAWHYFTAAPDVKRGKGDEWVEPMRPEFTLTKKGLENYIDEIARGHVTHFVMNLNSQRANFPSKTFEPLWKSLDEPEREHLDYIRAMKALYESGVDPYMVWIDRCRVKGIHPWISIRMNDLHRWDVAKSPNISTFWHEHPEYRLRPEGWDNGLDYTLEPVRKRMLDFITEVLDRYDPEGLELDLMRFRRYLPIGREKECAPIFTAYMREIRKVANAAAAKRGHTITLSVRLSSKPSESRKLGMEADIWAKEGIVDVIVPTSPWESIDFDIPLAEWRTWTGDKVPIVPSADEGITENGKRRIATFEEYRRWARIMHERGAKGLYLFNFFMHPQDGPVWNGVLSGGLAPSAALHAAEPVTIDLAKRTWQGIPGLEHTAKGRVFVSWFTGGTKEPAPENTVLLSHSDDGGKTFSAPQAMGLPLNDGTRCFDPCLWIDPKGRLWYIFNRGNKDTAKHDVWARICDDPDASPPVWGAEFRVGYDGPYAFRMNKPTVLSTGEWIMPVTHATETIQSWFAGPKQLQGVGISTDEGKTWSLHGALKAPEWALECMVTELKDGRLWLLTRTGGGFLWESHSTDKGRTWSEAKASTIANPGSRFFIRRLASGNLLLVNHYKFTGRSHLSAQLSTDDGATWNDGLLLDERKGVSYPDGVQDKDGLIWITYDRDRGGAGEILLAKFKEEDVVAGKNVSGAVSLKQVVNKLNKPAQPPKLVPANWNPKAAADKVIAGLIKVTAPEVKGAHGSKLTLIGGRAYVATLADNTTPGEKHGRDSVYSALSVVNLKTMTVEAFLTTAKSGQAFTNETLPRGACYASGTLLLNDHTLRCCFCSEQPGRGQSQMYYRDFDLRTRAFANDAHRVKLKTSSGVFDLQPQHLHADAAKHGFPKPAKDHALELLDAFKQFDGRTYAVLNSYVNALNALTVFNDAGDTLEVVGRYNEPFDLNLTESAVNRLPDGTWMAICRQEGGTGNYLFTTSRDGRTWTKAEPRDWVPNGTSSKPTFDKFGGIYYLGWQEATRIGNVRRSVFNVDVSTDCVTWERKYRFESTQTFQYPAFAEHDGAVWLTVSQAREGGGGPDRIMFGKLEDLPKPTVKVTQELLNSTRVGTGRELWNNNSAELAVIPVASLSVAAEASPGASLESRGLPRILFNNDSDDLKWPAYPEHHANGLWVPAGKYLPLPTINSLDDALAPRIGPLAKTKTQGLAYCGNFGLPIWELKRDHIAALGADPLQPILQFWKRDGRTFFFSMRMNDAHHEIFNWAHLWDDFRRTHRDVWIDPPTDAEWETQFLPWINGTGPKPVFPAHRDLRLDYSKPEVRKHYLDTLREACRRYALDGIELDWLRSPKLFRIHEEDTAIITTFVIEARAILDESAKTRGRPLRLVSRVPDSPELARAMGLDVEVWLKKGLLDAVIAGNGVMFSGLEFEAWVGLAHRYHTPVYGSLERMKSRKSFSRYGTPETLRAAAATLWQKGADGLYFFNFYLRDEMPLLDEFADRAKLAELPKEYFCDMDMRNGPWSSLGDTLLLTLKPGTPAAAHLVIADDPSKAKETNLELVFRGEAEFEPPTITLNGHLLSELKSTRGKAGLTLTLSSAALQKTLKRGTNDFSFISPASAKLTSLSVRVVP